MKQIYIFVIALFLSLFACKPDNDRVNTIKDINYSLIEYLNSFLPEDSLSANIMKHAYILPYDEIVYPDYYGGAFVDYEKPKLIVNFIGDSIQALNDISQRISVTNLILHRCVYSYNELTQLKRMLYKCIHDVDVDNIYVSSEENKVVIVLRNDTEENRSKIRYLVKDQSAIMFGKQQRVEAYFAASSNPL